MNVRLNNGVTALFIASGEGYEEVVRTLRDANADVNMRLNNGFTALKMAEVGDHWNVVRLLKQAGARR